MSRRTFLLPPSTNIHASYSAYQPIRSEFPNSHATGFPKLRLPLPKAHLIKMNARQYADRNQSHGHVKHPALDVEHVAHKARVRRGAKRRQDQQQVRVAAGAVELPQRTRARLAAVQRRRRPHGEADGVLGPEQHRQRGAERAVQAGKVRRRAALLVEVDGGEAGGEGRKRGQVEPGVHRLADALLPRVVRRLQHQDGLQQRHEAEELRQRVPRKQAQGPREQPPGEGQRKGDDGRLRDETGAIPELRHEKRRVLLSWAVLIGSSADLSCAVALARRPAVGEGGAGHVRHTAAARGKWIRVGRLRCGRR